ASRASSSAPMTTFTPSPRTLRSPSVPRAAISISLSLSRSRPVISQSIHTSLSCTGTTLDPNGVGRRSGLSAELAVEGADHRRRDGAGGVLACHRHLLAEHLGYTTHLVRHHGDAIVTGTGII